MIVVNEASTATFRARFFDRDGNRDVPLTAHYRLTDLTNDRVLIDWTEMAASAQVEVVIAASHHAIYDDGHKYQHHMLTIAANKDQASQYTDDIEYRVKNSRGFRS